MHPKALLDACADLVAQVLKFDHPADAVVSRYFREHHELGQQDRAFVAEAVFAVLRRRRSLEAAAGSASSEALRSSTRAYSPGTIRRTGFCGHPCAVGRCSNPRASIAAMPRL